MARAPHFSLAGKTAAVTIILGKERVITPLVETALGLRARLHSAFETARFGAFRREIARTGPQLDAACAKITADPRHCNHCDP